MKQVPIGVSGRHIHLSLEHIYQLFGSNYALQSLKPLSQPGQFAAQETVAIIGPKGKFDQVRILGPARKLTQIEISKTDSFLLGIQPPIRESGNTEATPGIRVVGPKGEILLSSGVIIAKRHIHFHPDDAHRWGIQDRQILQVKMNGLRPLIFDDVIARISTQFKLDMHIDTDEANAAGVQTGDIAFILL